MSEATLSPQDLPTSWAITTLGAVVDYGKTDKVEPSELEASDWVLELEDIEKDSSRLLQRVTFATRQSKSTKNRFQAGDVLYGKLRPYLNKVLIAGEPGCCTTEILPLKARAHIDNRYLFYWLKHPAFLKYVEAESHGMNMPRLGTETGKAAPFVLAPRNEQTRIANELDTMLIRVQACNDRFDAIPALLKRFRQTVLDTAVSGSLSEDWRLNVDQSDVGQSPGTGVADLPVGWRWSCPEELKAGDRHALAIGPFGSSLKVSDYKSEGVPLVFVREIRSRNFSSGSTKFVSVHKAQELKAHSIQGGDLLITKMGDPPGDIAIYPEDGPLAIITADCVRLRVDNTVALAAFVGYTIVCTDARERLRDITAGVAQRKISLSRFRHFPLPLAPLKEQAEIIRRVEALFALADRIEARCTAVRAQAQRLTQLVLAKAFRGELVPQDPSDEPASALLARIASSDTVVAGKNKHKVPEATKKLAQDAINL